MPGIGLSLSLHGHWHRSATTGVPVNTALPHFIDGAGATVTAPIVGQTYQVHPGTWTGSPTDYSYSISNTIGNNSGSWNATDPLPTFTAQDGDIGNAYTLTVTANNGLTASASSTPTSAVADVNLAAAITSVTRTSASGVTPMTADIAFASNVYEGYFLDRIVYTDSGLSTYKDGGSGTNAAAATASHYLTNADLQTGATIDWSGDGGPTIAATDWVQYRVHTTTPNGIYKSFTYGTAISPTDAVVAMAWNPLDKDAGATVSGTGNLNAGWGGGGSNYAGVRANRGLSGNGKWYWEYLVTGSSVRTRCAVADTSAPIGATWTPASQDVGFGAEPHAAAYPKEGTLEFNGAFTAYAAFADSAVIGLCLKISGTTKTLWVSVNGTWQNGDPSAETGGLSLTTMNTPIYPACQFSFGGSLTGRFTSASWTNSAPTGAVAP